MNRLSSIVLLAVLLLASLARAQSKPQAFLVTIGPGDEVWEKFGHNMLWARDRERGIDLCYNWGLFSFDQPGFIRKFVQGRMTYWMDGFPPNDILAEYFQNKRRTTMQRLNLSAEQVTRLIDLCETNRLPENRDYKYDYFKDNCSTRVRDMIDRVTDGSLQHLKTEYPAEPHSYRWQALRLMQDDMLITLGVDFAIGPSTDRPLTKWQECFLPEKLSHYVAPLIETSREPWQSDRPPEPSQPPIYWPWLLVVGLAGAAAMMAAAWWRRWAGWIGVGLWWFVAGLGGAFMSYVWAFTDHTAGYANQNLWHFSPLAWIGLLLLIVRQRRLAHRVALVIAAVSVLGFVLRGAMLLSQQNWDFIALAVPLNLAVVAVTRARRLTPTPQPSEVAVSS
ncbi:MAG: lipoprotein N-acyltransferase Lnb domain-containing protein [Tepidisphaeraceae bacterium]